TAGIALSYATSPRTTWGLNISEYRQQNRFQSSYTSTAAGSFGRKMSERWFMRMYAGGTYIKTIQVLLGAPPQAQAVGGASLGFKTYEHTLLASYDRSGNDTFGFAVGTITNASGAWNWHHPGSSWETSISFGEEQIRNSGFASISGWQGSAGISRRLSNRTNV